jgi:gamma-glutamyltranspeptidase
MKKMQISNPLKLGLLLSIPMFLAGIGSGVVAYQLGYASLKGVSQPDINPSKKFTNDRTSYARNQEFTPVSEAEVIKKVKVYIQQQTKNIDKDKANQKQKKDEKQSFLRYKRDKLRGFRWG